jgi:hypothetical protein
MKKLFPLSTVILATLSLIGCISIAMPEVIKTADIMPSQQGYNEPAETLFPVTIEQFQDTRPDQRSVGYNIGLGGQSNVMVDKNMSSVLEEIVTRELSFKGVKSGNSIFVLKGSVQRMSVGNMPFAQSSYSIMGEIAVELAIYNTRKNALVWSKTFAGKSMGNDYKTVLSQALKELTETIREDDSILKVKDIYTAALTEEPAERTRISSSRTHRKWGTTAASPTQEKPDVDTVPQRTGITRQNAYAIVIGIENYRQNLPKADYAVNDSKMVTEYLTKIMGYPEENVAILENDRAALGDFVKYFEKWLPNHVEKGGTVFIYYSGHGAPNPKTGDAYLVPYDGDPSFIDQTGYPLKRMYEALGKLPAQEIIIALDSCFSGAGGRSVVAKGARPLVMNLQDEVALSRNMTVLSASSGDQISSTYDEKRHGLFTYFLLKGIKSGSVVKQDGSIAVNELFSYLKPQVERIARRKYNNEQTPQLILSKEN